MSPNTIMVERRKQK